MCAVSKPASSIARSTASAIEAIVHLPSSGGPPACPSSVGASTSWWRSSTGSTSSQVRHVPVNPCRHTSGGPEPPRCEGVNSGLGPVTALVAGLGCEPVARHLRLRRVVVCTPFGASPHGCA